MKVESQKNIYKRGNQAQHFIFFPFWIYSAVDVNEHSNCFPFDVDSFAFFNPRYHSFVFLILKITLKKIFQKSLSRLVQPQY